MSTARSRGLRTVQQSLESEFSLVNSFLLIFVCRPFEIDLVLNAVLSIRATGSREVQTNIAPCECVRASPFGSCPRTANTQPCPDSFPA